MNTLTDLIWQSIVRGGLLAFGALLALWVLRRRLSAALCHRFLACAVAALGLMPVLIATCEGWALLPRWPQAEFPAAPSSAVAVMNASPETAVLTEVHKESLPLADPPREMIDRTIPGDRYVETSESVATSTAVAASAAVVAPPSLIQRLSWQGVLTTGWLLGMVLVLAGIAREWRRLHRLRFAASPVNDEALLNDSRRCAARVGLRRVPEMRLTQEEEGPLVIGAPSPAVVLPRDFPSWPQERRSAVLLHEMAHVKRQDAIVQLLGALVCAVHWCNPLAWLLLKRLRHQAECACDDAVLGAHMPASLYAEHLLAVASGGRGASALAPSMAQQSGLRQRVRSVLNTTVRRGTVGRLTGVVILAAAAAFSLPVMLAQPVEPKLSASGSAAASPRKVSAALQAVDASGAALAGATVRVFQTDKPGSATFEPDYVGTTDHEGRWQVLLPPGQFLVQATTDTLSGGFGGGITAWTLTEDQREVVSQVKMAEGGIVEATVFAASTGEPLANARLVMDTGHVSVTDASGHAVFKAVPHGERLLLVMSPPMGDAMIALNTTGRPVAKVEARLSPGFAVRGKVTNRAGAPVKGAEVRSLWESSSFSLLRRRNLTQTGPDGGYILGWYSGVRLVGYAFQVSHPDYAHQRYQQGHSITPPVEGTLSRCDFVLEQGQETRCIVKDEVGKPIKDAVVRQMGAAATSATDENGMAILKNLRFEWGPAISVQAKGYQPARMTVTAPKGAERTQVECVLKKGLTVEGRVVDRDGKPVSGVRIYPRALVERSTLSIEGSIVSDGDGRFQITGVPELGNTLAVGGEGVPKLASISYDPRKPLVITLDKVGAIVGRVIDAETRQPVKKFSVQFGIADSVMLSGPIYQAEDGRFVREDLVLGAGYPVNILAEGYTQSFNERVRARAMDDPAQPQEFLLERGIVVRGVIKDASNGRPVAGAKVLYAGRAHLGLGAQMNERQVVENSGTSYDVNAVRSDPAGAVVLHLPKESSVCSAFISAPGYAPVVLNGQPTRDGSLNIPPLTPEAKLRGTVKGVKGPDWGSFTAGRGPISISTPTYRVDQVTLNEDGSFEVGGLPTGGALVALYPKGFLVSPLGCAAVELRAGETTTVDMAAHSFARLKVILTKDGKPLPAVRIMVMGNEASAKYGDGQVGGGQTDADGTLTLEYLPRMKVMVLPGVKNVPAQTIDLSDPDHPTELNMEVRSD